MSIDALCLVLGGQLPCDLASLADLDPLRGRVLLAEVAEVAEEAGHVPHHPQKSPSCSVRFTGTS